MKKYHQLKTIEKKTKSAVMNSIHAEILLTEEPGYLEAGENEKTYQIAQREIVREVDVTSATKHFDLSLDFGPYHLDYFRNGRNVVIGGLKGHVACFDWMTKRLKCEFNVQESVHDVQFLHIPSMFAVAQKDWVHIYDDAGIELHCLKNLFKVHKLTFLPYHFLLVSASENEYLNWLDVSTGTLVTNFRVNNKIIDMCQNPTNAIIHTSHPNGTVCLWSPNDRKPVVKMLANPSAVRGVSVDTTGNYMATAGVDRHLRLWDLRKYQMVSELRLRSIPGRVTFSQRNMLGVSVGSGVEVYKELTRKESTEPYMRHKLERSVAVDVSFCNYEDVLGVGHERGITSVIIPGSGEANFDAFEANPFMTTSQRKEMEVKALLEKIQPELICLDPKSLSAVNVEQVQADEERKKNTNYLKPANIKLKRNKKRSKVKEVKTKQHIRDVRVAQLAKQKKDAQTALRSRLVESDGGRRVVESDGGRRLVESDGRRVVESDGKRSVDRVPQVTTKDVFTRFKSRS